MRRSLLITGIALGALSGISLGVLSNRSLWLPDQPAQSEQPLLSVVPAMAASDHLSESAMQEALAARDWIAVERLLELTSNLAQTTDADSVRIAGYRDYLTRGRRRDREFIIESPVELQLAVWMPNGSYGIGRARPDHPFTIRRDRTTYPLMLVWPDAKRSDGIETVLAQWRIFDVQGVEMNDRSDPDPSIQQVLAELPLRYLDGDGLAKLAPGLLAQFTELEAMDLSGVDAADCARLLSESAALPKIRSLRLPSRSGDSAIEMQAITSLVGLEELVIGSVGSKLRVDLSGLAQLSALRSLEVQGRSCLGSDLVAWSAGCLALETLRLGEVLGPSEEMVAGVQALSRLHALRDVRMTLRDAQAIAALGSLAQVDSLLVTVIADPDPAPAPRFHEFRGLTKVSNLNLRLDRCRNQLSIEEAQVLASLPALTNLTISGAVVSDEVLLQLARSTSLQNLRVEAASITDLGLEQMASLVDGTGLSRLTIVRCEGVTGTCLPKLVTMPSLIDLRLDRCPIPEAAWLAIKDPGGAEHIGISGSPVFTTASIDHVASWTRRPRIDLDGALLDDAAKKRLADLSASAIRGTIIATQEANNF